MTDLELRAVDGAELPAFHRALMEVFGEDPRDDDRAALAEIFEPERSLAAYHRDRIVATAGAYTRDVTVPGGPRPVAGVSLVSVAPTHRRHGLLTALMRRQLTDLYEGGGEPVAALWASEGAIYGRFGYGVAARQLFLSGATAAMGLRPDRPVGSGEVVLATTEEARGPETAVYEALRPQSVGFLSRPGAWLDRQFADPPPLRGGASARRHALHTEQDGTVTGFATYRTMHAGSPRHNDNQLQVLDLLARTPAAYAELWSFLVGIDLVPRLCRFQAPLDDPVQHLLADPRGLDAGLYDSLWVRLADVGRALAARAYAGPVDVVLDVRDEFCPWNAGRWRLAADAGGATCGRTADPAAVTLSGRELGAAYLGGPTLLSMAAAGLVTGASGPVAALSRAFAGERPPWCPEMF